MSRPLNSVRARLTAWNVGVVALVLAISAIALRSVLEVSLRGAIERDLSRQAMGFQRVFERVGPFWKLPKRSAEEGRPKNRKPTSSPDRVPARRDPPGASDSAAADLRPPTPPRPPVAPRRPRPPGRPLIDTSPADVRPRVLDLNGVDHRPEGAVGPWDAAAFDHAAKGEATFSTLAEADRRLRVYSIPAVYEGRVQGVIQVVEPLTATERALAQLDKTLWILVPIALLAAGLGGAFLSGRALKPVREVAIAAEAIQAENLSQRLPVQGADEFAQLTRVLNGMLQRLESAFERQRRFTGDASHELRTPLAVIKATSSLAIADEWEAEACHRAMRSIESAADRAERIVDDLLLLARADADTLLREPGPIRLDQILVAAAEEARLVAFKGTPILLEAGEISGLRVLGDRDQLRRVFINLLTNALRHTAAEGRIIVAAERQGGNLIIQIADNGEGIPAEHLAHLGERFYRVDSARGRTRGGSGLGLAICKAILAAHNGSMTIDSSEGVGTVVTVSLPAHVV